MGTLNPNIPSSELARLMTDAGISRDPYKIKLLTPQLLLLTFFEDRESVANQILRQLAETRGIDLAKLKRRVEMMARNSPGRSADFDFTDDFGKQIPLADEMLVVLDEAWAIAKTKDQLKASSGHALAAMADVKVTTYGALQREGITQAGVVALLDDFSQDGIPIIHDYLTEADEGKLQPVYQRDALLREMLSLLNLSQKRHLILTGHEGVGKRTLVYSLAGYLADKGESPFRSVVQINESALLENPLAAMRAGLRRASGGILLVPAIDRFFANRLKAKFPEQVSRELHKAILGDEQIIIGTATPAAYEILQSEAIIREHTSRLETPAMNRNETTAALLVNAPNYEGEYDVTIKADALAAAANLADQYLKNTAMPAAAVQLVHHACALVKMVIEEHLETHYEVAPDGRVDNEDIMVAASQMSKIPLNKLSEDESARYANMVEHIQQRIIGQEEAVLAVSRAVKTARVGLRDPKRPIGSFLFLGPSGVGKSELAKAVAEFMFGTEDAMITLDMSEYQEEASLNRLIGAPPGYVGFEGGGQLTNFVRERPYTVALFDEVEKAHDRIFDVLLQVMDEGRLTDSHGRTTQFNQAVIIMTSNLGARHLLMPVIGETERELVLGEVRRFFRPEFLNRLDDIIVFHQLTGEQLGLILELMLNKERKLTAGQGIEMTLTSAAKEWLLAQNDQPEFGARPLRRIIARHLREPLADFLLREGSGKGARVQIDADADGLQFKIDSEG